MKLTLRLAWRDMRGGLAGFGVFLACLAIGVGAIAAVGTFSRGLTNALNREGRAILGGDLSWSMVQRRASAEELAFMKAKGPLTETATMRAMARRGEGSVPSLVEIKAVDGAYPLAGQIETSPGAPLPELLGQNKGAYGAIVEAALLDKLGVKIGDIINLGRARIEIRAVLTNEPDKLVGGVGFGPRLLLSIDGLDATRLLQPGSLPRWHYRVAVPAASDQALDAIITEGAQRFPKAGWEARTRRNASQQLAGNIERFGQFLVLVGLTSLVVGGVGVANAVRSHIAARVQTIATLKALGASGGFVTSVYLTQTMIMAGLGIALGLGIGVALPALATQFLADILPIRIDIGLFPAELSLAAAYGVLIALAFALWPLGRAHEVSVRVLYRDAIGENRRRPRLAYVLLTIAAAASLVALAAVFSADWRFALAYAGSIAAAFGALRLVASAMAWLARHAPRFQFPVWRLALGNIHRPGAATPGIVLSLGLGLTLLATLSLVDGNLRRNLTSTLPERAPGFFFIDIAKQDVGAFAAMVAKLSPGASLDAVPMLRGRIVALNGVAAAEAKVDPDAAWVLNGDRGLTFADTLPSNSRLSEGSWWSPGDSTPVLVSFEAKLAKGLGLKVGDAVTVNVLGRDIEAKLANLREVEWTSLGINFVMVFSSSAFQGAPYGYLASLTLPPDVPASDEPGLLARLSAAFPDVVAIRVKEALEAVNKLVAQLALAVRAAAALTLASGMVVLAGAVSAGQRARIRDAVILKALGATRARIAAAYIIEYGLLGLGTAFVALAAGSLAAYLIVVKLMKFGFVMLPGVAALTIGIALTATLGFGLMGTWRILRHKPAVLLRAV